MSMKALVKIRPGEGIRMEEVPVPRIGQNDLLIRVEKAALCGTDLHIIRWDEWAARRHLCTNSVGGRDLHDALAVFPYFPSGRFLEGGLMNPENKSKINELIGDLEKLRSRNPEEVKFKDWKDKTERKLEELFGKGAEQCGRFHSLRFFDFSKRGSIPKDTPLREEERSQYLGSLEEAKKLLRRFMDY
jgi:hypothetical protein